MTLNERIEAKRNELEKIENMITVCDKIECEMQWYCFDYNDESGTYDKIPEKDSYKYERYIAFTEIMNIVKTHIEKKMK